MHATIKTLSTASAELTTRAIHLPQTYAKYVGGNSGTVSQVESGLRYLTYLVPGARFHEAEIASESINSFIQLLSIYHDHLLKHRATVIDESPTLTHANIPKFQKPKPSLHARYTTYWSTSSSLYAKVATLLKVAQYTELLWEMVARRRGGEKARWRVVVLLESFKVLCRLVLLRLTNSRPLLSAPMPLREDFAPPEPEMEVTEDEMKMVDDTDVFEPRSAFGIAGVPTPPLSDSGKESIQKLAEPFNMPRTGFTLPTLPTPETVSAYLLAHVITPDDVKPAKQLLHRLTSLQGQTAEVIYILRPLVYAALMQRLAKTYGYEGTKWKKAWTPWLIGLSMEYFSRQLAKRDLLARVPGGTKSGLSALEREELKGRGKAMAWWGMRGAFYENITKKYVHGFAEKLKGKPLLDMVGGVVEDYEYLWGTYYFSTSSM